jgi:hypothetical protein
MRLAALVAAQTAATESLEQQIQATEPAALNKGLAL